jgi:carbon storage regulator
MTAAADGTHDGQLVHRPTRDVRKLHEHTSLSASLRDSRAESKGVSEMLVLSRKLNQAIILSGGIRVTVVGIRGNQIRLGIEAPESVGIMREELCTRSAVEPTGHDSSISDREAVCTPVGARPAPSSSRTLERRDDP